MILLDRLRAVRSRALVGRGINRLFYALARDGEYNCRGTDGFADEDWDTLVLLDACRYDVYADRSNRSPRGRAATTSASRRSNGSFGTSATGCDPGAPPRLRPSDPPGLNPRRSRGR